MGIHFKDDEDFAKPECKHKSPIGDKLCNKWKIWTDTNQICPCAYYKPRVPGEPKMILTLEEYIKKETSNLEKFKKFYKIKNKNLPSVYLSDMPEEDFRREFADFMDREE